MYTPAIHRTRMNRNWQDYQKEIADDRYYYVRSCIRQNFFPGSEKAFLDIMHDDLGRDCFDDPLHTSCTGIGYHADIVPLETIMTVVARQFALMRATRTSSRRASLRSASTPRYWPRGRSFPRPRSGRARRSTRPRAARWSSPRIWRTRRTSSSTTARPSPHAPGTGW